MAKNKIDIKKSFIELTDHLYPHGSVGTDAQKVEDFKKRAEKILKILEPYGLEEDEYGNLYKLVGDGKTTVMFTCHLDTATSADGPVKHVFEDKYIKTDGKTILGADDKAGTVLMMNMMENEVPGLYYFFMGEEVGCLGSRWLGRKLEDDKWIEKPLYKNIDKVISFDRKGYKSIISHQSTRTASDEFCDELAKRLNKLDDKFVFETDPTGSYTDSARVSHVYPECTNISVGYFSQHTKSEKQDIDFLIRLAEATTKIDWESLPVKRDPKKDNERRSYGNSYSGDDYDNWHGHGYGGNYNDNKNKKKNRSSNTYSSTNSSKGKTKIDYWHDDKYDELVELSYVDDKLVNVIFSEERCKYEGKIIQEVFDHFEIPYNNLTWDGVELTIDSDMRKSKMNREQLYEFLPELKYDMVD